MGFFSLILGYLLGSIPSGWLAGRWLKGIDLRELGSGSTGATNVLRQVGKGPALVVFLIDVGKGSAAVLVARALGLGGGIQVLAGLTALAGHIWPMWLNFKGGKAVATGFGMFLGLAWPVGLAGFGVFLLTLGLCRIVSLSSVLAAVSLPLLMICFSVIGSYNLIALVAMGLVLGRHRSNLARILKGSEPKVGQKD